MSLRRSREFAALHAAGWTVTTDNPWRRLRALLADRRERRCSR